MERLLCGILVSLFLVGSVWAAPSGNAEFKQLKQGYEQGLERVQKARIKREQDLLSHYAQSLRKLDSKLKTIGDLDGVLEVCEEEKRVAEGDPEVIKKSSKAGCAELSSCRSKFLQALESIRNEAQDKRIQLTKRYIDRLNPLKKRLVQQDLLEEAIFVKREIQRVSALMEGGSLPASVIAKAGPEFSKSHSKKSEGRKPSPIEDFEWKAEGDGICIVKYKGNDKVVVIPDEIDGKPVRVLKELCFSGNQRVEEILISENVKWIGYLAFRACANVRKIDLACVEGLGAACFQGTGKLRIIHLPASLKVLRGSFAGTEMKDKQVLIDVNNPNLFIKNGMVYADKGRRLEAHLQPDYTYFRVPDGVEEIRFRSFDGAKFEQIFFPESIKQVGTWVFGGSVRDIYFSGDKPKFDKGAFKEATLETIYYREGAKGWPEEIEGIPTKALKNPPSWVKEKSEPMN